VLISSAMLMTVRHDGAERRPQCRGGRLDAVLLFNR
jgi:hypothetical protein